MENTEIKTERNTIVESSAIRVTITADGQLVVSTTWGTIDTVDDLRLAARTLIHAADFLTLQNESKERIQKLTEKTESNENH